MAWKRLAASAQGAGRESETTVRGAAQRRHVSLAAYGLGRYWCVPGAQLPGRSAFALLRIYGSMRAINGYRQFRLLRIHDRRIRAPCHHAQANSHRDFSPVCRCRRGANTPPSWQTAIPSVHGMNVRPMYSQIQTAMQPTSQYTSIKMQAIVCTRCMLVRAAKRLLHEVLDKSTNQLV